MVIPCVNAPNEEEVKKQLEKIAPLGAPLIHWDITDGAFTPHISWGEAPKIQSIFGEVKDKSEKGKARDTKLEIHLMVTEPEEVLDAWLATGLVARVIIHVESRGNLERIREKCRAAGVGLMLSIAPKTDVSAMHEKHRDNEAMQVLAVSPGPAGQPFNPAMVERVKALRTWAPHAIIEVDGGINPATLLLYKNAGATNFVSGAYITNAADPEKTYAELQRAAEE